MNHENAHPICAPIAWLMLSLAAALTACGPGELEAGARGAAADAQVGVAAPEPPPEGVEDDALRPLHPGRPTPADAPADAPADLPADAPVDEPADAPADVPADDPADPPAAPADDPADPPAAPVDEPADPPAAPVDEPADPPAAPVDEPADPPAAPVDEPADPPAAPVDEPADPPAAPAAAPPAWLGVTSLTHKLRSVDALPAAQAVEIEAARNEFEGFQLAFAGGAAGRTVRGVSLSTLTGPAGARITADNAVVYKVAQYDVPSASNDEGDAGEWPDPLVPDVDPYYGERRNAFPLVVPTGRLAAVLVDLHVPTGIPAGRYTGTVTVDTADGAFAVPVGLRVFDFDLPSTSSLPTMFGIGWDAGCVAHHGSYEACGGDAGILHYGALYAKVALDNRISLGQMVYFWPRNDDWSVFEDAYGALLDGSHDGRLAGAKMTTLATHARWAADPEASVRRWKGGVEDRGWDVTLFEYVCDEPPYGCQWGDIPGWAEPVRRAGVNTLVTTGLPEAAEAGVLDSIDLLTPLMNWVGPNGAMGTHADYRSWMNQDPNRKMWWYQSCISHGCGNGCDTSRGEAFNGWPSYVIDASAIQARAMEWFTFRHGVGGELYFATTDQLATAWTNQCRYSGSGDGTLFYPGKPSIIGGQTDIPIESQRMKLIREGLEDYEYLHLLEQLGEGDFARAQVDQLFPSANTVTATTADELKAARRALAERIEARN